MALDKSPGLSVAGARSPAATLARLCVLILRLFEIPARVCVYYCSTYFKVVRVGGGG